MQQFDVEDAAPRLEELIAMAFNGEDVRIKSEETIVRIAPIPEEVESGKFYAAADFYE